MNRKVLFASIVSAIAILCGLQQAGITDPPKVPTKTVKAVWRPVGKSGGHFVWFQDLAKIRTMKPGERMVKLDEKASKLKTKAKTVTLPIDWTKGNTIQFPMDGNDQYGDCYMAAASHADNTWSGNAWSSFTFSLGTFSTNPGTDTSILNRYGFLSGGDNGLGDSDVQGEMLGVSPGQGYVANGELDPTTTITCQQKAGSILDWMQFDPTNATQTQALMQRYGCCIVTFGVPDAWVNNSNTGAVWDAPATPDQANGHAVIWNGCRASDGAYCLQTWGSYVWVTPAGAKAAQFVGWIAFSPRWFNAKGYAPNGEHIVDLAAQWVADGGKPIAESIISQFPPPNGPVPPPPPPPPNPPTPKAGTYILKVNSDGTSTLTPVTNPVGGATGTYTINADGSITLTPASMKTSCIIKPDGSFLLTMVSADQMSRGFEFYNPDTLRSIARLDKYFINKKGQ